jgi:hypothetical protein
MCDVLHHHLAKGCVPPPVGYPLRLAQLGIEAHAPVQRLAVASPVRLSRPTPRPTLAPGWMRREPVTPLRSRVGAFAPPAVRLHHDQPCAGWMRATLVAVGSRPGRLRSPRKPHRGSGLQVLEHRSPTPGAVCRAQSFGYADVYPMDTLARWRQKMLAFGFGWNARSGTSFWTPAGHKRSPRPK